MAMRPGLRCLCGRRSTAAPDLRTIRDEHVSRARERIFGPQGDMPGDRYFRKKLEGSELMRWYFPSKYNLQDFRVDDYFEMQAERHAPRDVHRCIPMLTELLERASVRREQLRSFFQQLDEVAFMNNPTLQDLYGVFRLVDPDPALAFSPPPSMWREHSPLYSQAPPFRAFAGDAPKKRRHAASEATLHGSTSDAAELRALFLLLKSKLGDRASTLEARVTLLRSLEDVREVLLEEAQKLGAVVPFEDVTVIVEELQQKKTPHDPAFSESPAVTKASADGTEGTAEANAAGTEKTAEANATDTKVTAEAKSVGVEGTSEAMPHREDNATADRKVAHHLIGSWRYGLRGSFNITHAEGSLHLESRISTKLIVSGVLDPVAHDDDSSASWLQAQLLKPDKQVYGLVRLRDGEDPGIIAFQMQSHGAVDWSEERQAKMEPRPDQEEKLAKDQGAKTFQTDGTRNAEAVLQEVAPSTAMTKHETSQSEAVDVPPVLDAATQHEERSTESTRSQGQLTSTEQDRWNRSKARLVAYAARPRLGGDAAQRNEARVEAEKRLGILRTQGATRDYLARRHRFVDPMYRRRRLKWLERHMAQQHNEIEVKFNNYYAPHPDDIKEWPTNKGSVTVEWPSPYH